MKNKKTEQTSADKAEAVITEKAQNAGAWIVAHKVLTVLATVAVVALTAGLYFLFTDEEV